MTVKSKGTFIDVSTIASKIVEICVGVGDVISTETIKTFRFGDSIASLKVFGVYCSLHYLSCKNRQCIVQSGSRLCLLCKNILIFGYLV